MAIEPEQPRGSAQEADQRLDDLERRASVLTDEAEAATRAAIVALRDLKYALQRARRQMRQRGYPLVNEMGPR